MSNATPHPPTDVTCDKCGYTWEYGGELLKATCPSCNTKTPTNPDEDPDD